VESGRGVKGAGGTPALHDHLRSARVARRSFYPREGAAILTRSARLPWFSVRRKRREPAVAHGPAVDCANHAL
jgi:hypothetical protein